MKCIVSSSFKIVFLPLKGQIQCLQYVRRHNISQVQRAQALCAICPQHIYLFVCLLRHSHSF